MDKTNKILKTIQLILIICLNSLVPLFIWPINTDYFYYPKVVMIYILVLITLLYCIIFFKHIKLKFSRELLPMVFFIILVILSAAFSDYKPEAFHGAYLRYEGAFTYICYFLILYFSFTFMDSWRHMEIVTIFIMASAFLISIYGIFQYLGFEIFPRDYIRESWTFISFATLGNPNFLGSYLSMILPAAVCLYYRQNNINIILLLFLTIITFYSALICTMTRSAWIGTSLALLVLIIIKYKSALKHIKKTMFLMAACMIVTFMLNNYHGGLVGAKFKSIGDDYKKVVSSDKSALSAGSQRMFIWTRAAEYLFDRPFLGSGPDTFHRVFKMSAEEGVLYFGSKDIYVDKAHNEYLQIIITMGFPALTFYIFFLTRILYKSARIVLGKKNNIYVLCFSSGILSYITQAFFNISVVSVAPLFWSMLGLLLASQKISSTEA